MFRIKSIIIIVSFLLLSESVSFAKFLEGDPIIDAKVGDSFKGIVWGIDISAVQDMRKTGTTLEGIDTYVRDGDDLSFEGMVVKNIEYGFWEGKFCGVTLMIGGEKDWDALKKLVLEKYGLGTEVINDKDLQQYIWQGKAANISLTYYYSSGEGSLIIIKNK